MFGRGISSGTFDKPYIAFRERWVEGVGRDEYEYVAITCQDAYRNFSIEEHRLADYNQGKTSPSRDTNARPFTMPNLGLWDRNPSIDKTKLDLLRGSGIEIHVGTSTLSDKHANTDASNTWSLPIKLITHHSPFFKAACSWDFQERRNKRIELPEDDPTVFALFVEWMYYGSYDVRSLTSHSSIDVRCWVLGDKLLCTDFKNYAMSRLYARQVGAFSSSTVACDDVLYACDNTPASSKLRQFYADFVIEHFSNPSKLHGTVADWDTLLQSCSDIRLLLLQNVRQSPPMQTHVRDVKDYFESNESHLNKDLKLQIREKDGSE
ncbi:hypothetical protein B0I35DRAFT_266332 [Stachybotrys elegans]|uniref:BTB domain-containing protein n=1 Tax=Stachybotrys elegans TaxID=80388 RepID=A0A8K0SQM5_9HYPO|nr:hypothetical protein B0I35DRAFT_266332 [Stachybotrys elegans]